MIIFAHELGHAEQFRYKVDKGLIKNLFDCKRHYASIHRNLNKTIMHEVEAWTYARKILKKNNISRKGLLKIAAYSLNNRIEKPKEKPPYTESWTLALKTFFKVIAIYFRYYQETKTLYKFGQIV